MNASARYAGSQHHTTNPHHRNSLKGQDMNDHLQTPLNPKDARTAGALYLAIAICGGFSIGYVPTQIVVAEDAAASAVNLLSQPGLFRLGVLADSAVIILELAITVILYQMFHLVSPKLAMIALISRAGMITVMGINLLLWVMPYLLLTTPSELPPLHTSELAQMFFGGHDLGVFIWQLFFGTHLLALGWMILRSTFVPHVLGWGLFVGAFGYLIQGLAELTFTDVFLLDMVVRGLLIIVTLSELGFAFWLLIRGIRGSATQSNSTPQIA
jgi:hypothetical protein